MPGAHEAAVAIPRQTGALGRASPALSLFVLLLASAAWLMGTALLREDIHFLVDWAPARWIIYPNPGATGIIPEVPMETVFRRSFSLSAVPPEVTLRWRAFRSCTIEVNGRELPRETLPRPWKRETALEVTSFLHAGENEIRVAVNNDAGPPALWLALTLPASALLTTDESWEASLAGATWCQARFAALPLRYPVDPLHLAKRVVPSLAEVWPNWLTWGVILFTLLWILQRRMARAALSTDAASRLWNRIIPGVVMTSLLLVAILFVQNSRFLPVETGFDAPGHLEYIQFIQEHKSLPWADQGMHMYHPPLYYLCAAIWLGCWGAVPASVAGMLLIRLYNLCLLAVMVFATLGCLRILFPGQPRRQLIGILFTAFLPLHLYLFQFPTNEVLAGALAAVVSMLALRLVSGTKNGIRDAILLGLALGAGMLAKITAALLFPPLAMVLVAKAATAASAGERRRIGRQSILICVLALGVCGWYYFRNWSRFGTPLICNAETHAAGRWWQSPGFYTPEAYLRFGRSLEAPLFSALESVWDGFYATLWSDAACGGALGVAGRPPWSDAMMVAGLGLSIILSVGIVWGMLLQFWRYVRQPTLAWTYLFLLCALEGIFLVWFTFASPYHPAYSAIKASYGLPATLVLSAFLAVGLDAWGAKSSILRLAVLVFLGVWGVNSLSAFRVSPHAVGVRVHELMASSGNLGRELQIARTAVQEHPGNALARILLCDLYLHGNHLSQARREMEMLPGNLARRHFLEANLCFKLGRRDDGLREMQVAMELDPDDVGLAETYVQLLESQDPPADPDLIIQAGQNVLRIDPYSVRQHDLLAKAYRGRGENARAQQHELLVRRLTGHNAD